MHAGLVFLKVKAKSLASEARAIRREEAKKKVYSKGPHAVSGVPHITIAEWTRRTDAEREATRFEHRAMKERAALIAADTQVEPDENIPAARAAARKDWLALAEHRRTVVRPEARATLMAYAFLRGRSIQSVEATFHNPSARLLTLIKARQLVERYGAIQDGTDSPNDLTKARLALVKDFDKWTEREVAA